jgi:hypothetical protein
MFPMWYHIRVGRGYDVKVAVVVLKTSGVIRAGSNPATRTQNINASVRKLEKRIALGAVVLRVRLSSLAHARGSPPL